MIWYTPIRWRGFLTGSFFNLITLNLELKKKYEGEIGSSDFDDPFTQEEKIGKGGKPKPSERRRQEELQRERDYSEEIGQDTRQEAQREYTQDRLERFSSYDHYFGG